MYFLSFTWEAELQILVGFQETFVRIVQVYLTCFQTPHSKTKSGLKHFMTGEKKSHKLP